MPTLDPARRSPRTKPSAVDTFLRDGCGRCERYQTAACKVHRWQEALRALREVALAAGLEEDVKWGFPCYSLAGTNVVSIAPFSEHCALQFFQGAALADEDGELTSPGASSRFMRRLQFASAAEVTERLPVAEKFIARAAALAREGKRVEAPPAAEPIPDELARRLAKDAKLRKAFEALTPGRRRSHILHVSGAKQSETRARRVDRCAEDILAGRGFNER